MRCPHCGAPHQEDGFRCEHCNKMIDPVQPKTTWRSIVIGGIVLIILGIIGFAFIYMDSNKVGVFEQDELRTFTGQKDEAFRLTGKGDQAEVHIFSTHVLRLLLCLCFFVF